MKALVAWRILAHQKGRSGLAIAAIFVATLLTSSAYVFEEQSSTDRCSRRSRCWKCYATLP